MSFIKPVFRDVFTTWGMMLALLTMLEMVPRTLVAAPPPSDKADAREQTASGTFVAFKDGTLTIKRQSRLFSYERVGANYKTFRDNENGPGSKLVDTVDALSRVLPGTVLAVNVEDREISFGLDHRVIGNFESYDDGALNLIAADVPTGFIPRSIGHGATKVEPGTPVLESIDGGDYTYAGPIGEVAKTIKKGTLLTARSEFDADAIEVIQIGEPKRKMERYVGQTRGTLRGTFVSFKDGVLRIHGRGVNALAANEYDRLINLRVTDAIPIVESIDGDEYQPAGNLAVLSVLKEGTIVTVRRVEGVILEIQIGLAKKSQPAPAHAPAK